MKKFLLSLFAAAAVCGTAAAENVEVAFDFANNDYGMPRQTENNGPYLDNGTTFTSEGVTVTLNKTEGKNGWRLWTDGLRAYKNSDAAMTITAGENIAAVKFTMAKTSVITAVNDATISDKDFTVATSGTTVDLAFTITNNGAISSMTVILGESGEVPVDPTPDPVDTEGKGTEESPYTVADVIALNNPGTTAWVTGYIVGVINYDNNSALETEVPTTVNTCIAIAATAGETVKENCVPVQLTAGSIREALNLVDNPENLGKKLSICGQLTAYFGMHGLKSPSAFSIEGGTTPKPVAETASLTSFVEDQCSTNTKILGTVTVFYQSPDKKYTFITDGETNLEVYGQMTNEYKNGDQLTGIIGKYGYYQNMPQMTPDLSSFGEATAGTQVEPTPKALASVQPNDYVLLTDVKVVETVGETATTYSVIEGDTEYVLFNRFGIEAFKAIDSATVLGIGAVFGETKQIFPITITDNASISEIVTEQGEASIYDLQGRRLAAPIRGINIINGHKVLVK